MLSKVDRDYLIIAKEGKYLQKLPNPLHEAGWVDQSAGI